MKKLAKLFLGFSIAAIGVLWILNVTGVIGFDIFFRGWWTLLIILPCTAHLIAHPNWGSFSGIALGAILLLQAQGYIDWSVFWKLCLAIIFIAFGIMLIFSKSGRPESWNCHDSRGGCSIISRDGRNILKISSAFGEQNHRVEAEEFDGADKEASFGSVRLDLRNAIFNEDVEVRVKRKFCRCGNICPERCQCGCPFQFRLRWREQQDRRPPPSAVRLPHHPHHRRMLLCRRRGDVGYFSEPRICVV